MMDEITGKRLDRLDFSIAELRDEQRGARAEAAKMREEMVREFRQLDLRLTTEVREVTGMLRDLKAWLVERDDTKQRIVKLEAQVTEMDAQVTELLRARSPA